MFVYVSTLELDLQSSSSSIQQCQKQISPLITCYGRDVRATAPNTFPPLARTAFLASASKE